MAAQIPLFSNRKLTKGALWLTQITQHQPLTRTEEKAVTALQRIQAKTSKKYPTLLLDMYPRTVKE